MEKKSGILVWAGYFYIILPILIFFIGWCNSLTAVTGVICILISSFFLYKNTPKIWFPSTKKEIILLGSIFVISLIWVYSSGIGALVFQNFDHNCRNPIFELMVNQNWPVESSNRLAILTYYIGFWLPPAVVGKIFHSTQIGYYAQVLWASIGVFLFFYYVLATLKKKTLWPVILFIFFSGLDIIGEFLIHGGSRTFFNPVSHLEWWYPGMQFSSFTTQLYWVFNQAIPAWIITMLIYLQRNNKNMIFIYSCMFLHSTLPAIGILPFLAYCGLKNNLPDNHGILSLKNILNSIKTALTFENIAGGGIITIVTYLYLSNNVAGGNFALRIPHPTVWIFYLLEAGIFVLCIWKYNKKNVILYLITIMLLIYPFIRIGFSNDFCMRATIPALVLLYLLVVQTFDRGDIQKDKPILVIMIASLLIGAVTPLHEMTRTIVRTASGITKVKPDLGFDNFFGWKEDNSFLKYFGKKKD